MHLRAVFPTHWTGLGDYCWSDNRRWRMLLIRGTGISRVLQRPL